MDIIQVSEQILQLRNELARLHSLIESDAAALQNQLRADHHAYQAEVARARASHLDRVYVLSRRLKAFSTLVEFSNLEPMASRVSDSSSDSSDKV